MTTILEALDWHANSNGRKYFSALTEVASPLGKGNADEAAFSSLLFFSSALISSVIKAIEEC